MVGPRRNWRRCSGSSTAVRRTTEKTGKRILDAPQELIDERQKQRYSLMVVEVYGTTSPQITEHEGSTGRDRLRAPTCFKECNLVVIEKRCDEEVIDRWTGAHYGPCQEFAEYAEQTGLRMGFLEAPRTLVLAMAHAITGNCSRLSRAPARRPGDGFASANGHLRPPPEEP